MRYGSVCYIGTEVYACVAVMKAAGEELEFVAEFFVGLCFDQIWELSAANAVIVLGKFAIACKVVFHFRGETRCDWRLLIGVSGHFLQRHFLSVQRQIALQR